MTVIPELSNLISKEDLPDPQQETKSDKSKETDNQNDGTISENVLFNFYESLIRIKASDQPKPSENSESMVVEEPQKLTSVKSR